MNRSKPEVRDAIDAAAGGARAWLQVGLIVLVGIVTAGQIYKLAPSLPVVRADLDLSLVQSGWLFSVINATTALVGLMAGSIADHFGVRRTMLAGLVLVAAAAAAGAFAGQFAIALGLRFIEGLGVLAVAAAAPALIISVTTIAQRPLALAAWPIYMPLGASIASLGGGFAVATIGWHAIWLAMALLSLLAMAAIAYFIHPAAAPRQAAPVADIFRRLHATLRNPAAVVLCLAMLAFTCLYGPFFAWLPTYLVEQRGLSTDAAGYITGAIVATNIIGNLSTGWLLARGFRHWQIALLAGGVMLAASVMLFAPPIPDPLRLLGAVLFTVFSGLIPGCVFTAIPVFTADARNYGAFNGLIIQGAQTGHVVGPPLLAWLVGRAGGDWSIALWLFVLLSGAIMALALVLRRLPPAGG